MLMGISNYICILIFGSVSRIIALLSPLSGEECNTTKVEKFGS